MPGVGETLRVLTDATRRHRLLLTVALGALLLVVLAALAIPVGVPDEGAAAGQGGNSTRPTIEVAQDEDLAAFLASSRWGVVLRDIMDEAAAAAEAAEQKEITPELARIGFVGIMEESAEYGVLLVLPDGKISRLAEGDTLPDGRALVSVTDNSLTLEGGDGSQDVLPLFPRVRTE